MAETVTPTSTPIQGGHVGDITEGKVLLTKKPVIACIAAGQGGYNAMRAMWDKPFCSPENSFYLNYQTDLLSAKLLDPEHRININENAYGAGKSRDKAKSDATQTVTVWSEELASKINPKTEKIYVMISAGGGFGSGAGPLISAVVSQDKFLNRKGRKLPVEVVMFKPALSANREEWYNYSECLKEMTSLVNAKAISLYIADLSSSNIEDPDERNLAVDAEVAELLYRFECLNFISNTSNLDFEDRYVLSSTPKMRGLLRFNETDGSWSSPFVMPKGVLVNRLGYEVPEGSENIVEAIAKSFGVTVLDKSFKGIYPTGAASSGAYPIMLFSGFNVPESLLAESNDVVTELNRKAEAVEKADKEKSKGAFDMLSENKAAIEESNSTVDTGSIENIMNLING